MALCGTCRGRCQRWLLLLAASSTQCAAVSQWGEALTHLCHALPRSAQGPGVRSSPGCPLSCLRKENSSPALH